MDKRINRKGIVLAVLALASCGGSGSADEPAQPGGAAEPEVTTQVPAATVDSPASGDFTSVEGFKDADASAVVTIDGVRYEFADLYCVTMAGALGAASIDGDPQVQIDLPPTGWESSGEDWSPPAVSVQNVAADLYYTADAFFADMGLAPVGQSQVDDFTSDGFSGSGSATFHESPAGRTVTGTFEVTCPRP